MINQYNNLAAGGNLVTGRLAEVSELGRCLVTGGAGFLGRNLVKVLLQSGCQVSALVNRTALDFQHPNLTLIRGDITSFSDMERACKGIDTVFHTAALIALLGGRFASTKYRQEAWRVFKQNGVEIKRERFQWHYRAEPKFVC